MNVIFTIVAKNYLASAITLGKSVQKNNVDCDFIIFLSDKEEGISLDSIEFPIYPVNQFNIPYLEQQTFMYDVVEFATAVKPYFMLYLMNERGYDKVIYLDPDTWVMDSLEDVFEKLQKWDFVLTPHIVDMDCEPNKKETLILDRGVFNLGFLGARNNDSGKRFLEWWKERLERYCFRDELLFVDQKWINYLPVFSDSYYVMRSKAYNIADWNYHERKIVCENGRYYIKNEIEKESVKFFHFSGVKMQSPDRFLKKQGIHAADDNYEALVGLISEYQSELVKNGFGTYSGLAYAYGSFSNGDKINLIYRRIYREYRDRLSAPFSVTEGSFYKILKKERMISRRKAKNEKQHSGKAAETIAVQDKVGQTLKGRLFIKLMKLIIRACGIDNYLEVLKQLHVGTDINEQTFLVSKYFDGTTDNVKG